jgi:4-hydroxy-2-oxoheptanedioate aldolase
MYRKLFNIKFSIHLYELIFIASILAAVSYSQEVKSDLSSHQERVPKRINKCIELLQAGQPIYYISAYGGYDEGRKLAKTWADYIIYNMEHHPLDFSKLHDFMKGLVDGGPTPSGHRTPAVIVSTPLLGLDSSIVRADAWMFQQALAQGVHGIELARARNPQAVRELIQAIRYPIHLKDQDKLGVGYRGYGSQKFAEWVWGVDDTTYLKKADVWPLNPEGEIMVGVKIEDTVALRNCDKTLAVPGICFAEHGPRDMGLMYGHLEGRADPPVPPEVAAAGEKVLAECKKNHLYFLDNVLPDNVIEKIKHGIMIGAGSNEKAAEIGREYTKRKMPW